MRPLAEFPFANPFTAIQPICVDVVADGTEIQDDPDVKQRKELELLCLNKNGVLVFPDKSLEFGGVQIGSPVSKRLVIQNESDKLILLRNINIEGMQSVCRFEFETTRPREGETILACIDSGEVYSIKVTCKPEQLGRTTDSLLLDFGTFKISRVLRATGLSSETVLVDEMRIKVPGLRLPWKELVKGAASKIIDEKKCTFVRGINPIRRAFFAPKRLKNYSVPNYLKTIVVEADEVELVRRHPCVLQELTVTNYLEKFQVALWVEEVEHIMIRRKYDLEDVTIQVTGEYATFEVTGLKHIRPPLLIGDSICIIDTNVGNKYQAFIYDIRGCEIYTKVNDDLRAVCLQTPVRIEFRRGRRLYRCYHYAVENAIKYLGEDWLFCKDEMEFKPPRITFVEIQSMTVSSSAMDSESSDDARRKFTDVDTMKGENGQKLNLFRKHSTKATIHRQKTLFRNTGRILNHRMPSMLPFKSDTCGPSQKRVCLKWFNTELNTEQKNAVRGILRGVCRPLPYIVFGPPGTGKTVTLVEAVMQVHILDKNSRTLVVGPSNSSVDRIAELLVKSGVFGIGDFVRLVGFLREENTIPETIRPFCVDGSQITKVASHRLVVTTCMTSGQFHLLNLKAGHFTHVFIDEAGYTTEPEALVAVSLIALQHSGQLILAGDPKQLGPVIMSDVAIAYGLSLSLLERFMNRSMYARNVEKFPVNHYNSAAITKLRKNYRAHASLLKLPSELFYDQEIEAVVPQSSVKLYESLDFMRHLPSPLLFHGIQGTCRREKTSPSSYNTAEVIQLVDYVRKLKANGVPSQDIGIITPYREQAEKIRIALQLAMTSQSEIPKIGTVEQFQGVEHQVTLLSLVRSAFQRDVEDEAERENDHLTFIFSPKRFNVAVTRAKSVLIVLGNPHILAQDDIWKKFLKYCIELGCYTGCNLPPSLERSVLPMTLENTIQELLPRERLSPSPPQLPCVRKNPIAFSWTKVVKGIVKFTNPIMLAIAACVFNINVKYPMLSSGETGFDNGPNFDDVD